MANNSSNSRRYGHSSSPAVMPCDGAAGSDDDDDQSDLSRAPSRASAAGRSPVGSHRRPSFTYGQSRPVFVPGSPLSTATAALASAERATMLEQELRDNGLAIAAAAAGSPATTPATASRSGDYGALQLWPAVAPAASNPPPAYPALADEHARLLGSAAHWEEAVGGGTTYLCEARVVLASAPLLYITFALQYSLTVASVFSAGRLGKDQLAGVSLGSMTATITGYAIFQGLATALDTLCSQSYGSGHKALVGLHLQRMVYFLLVVSLPVAAIWSYSGPILRSIVPEPGLVEFASLYLRVLTLGMPAYAMFEAGKRFLQAQGLFMASTYVLLICAPLNALMNYVLVWHPTIGLGFVGAPIAVVVTEWLMALLLLLYVKFVAGSECWAGFTRAGFRNWMPMINLAVPGMVMLEAEWLAFEILTLLASYWSTAHVAANSVLSTTASMAFQLPFALSVAVSTRVANLLGAAMGDSARKTARLGLMLSAGVGLFNYALVMAMRRTVVGWFSDDPEVHRLFLQTVPLAGFFQVFDAIGACTAGLLRGQGRQHLGSYINLAAYYVVALPISLVCSFVLGWQLVGLWIGFSVGLIFIAGLGVALIMHTDWDRVVDEAKNRVDHS